jgi:hypothetical protein
VKPSDFFVHSRQFFGFLIPGAMWVSAAFLVHDRRPDEWVGDGLSVVRAISFLGLSYVVGIIMQTVLFWIKEQLFTPQVQDVLADVHKEFIRSEMKKVGIIKNDQIKDTQLPVLCKLYVLEHSGTMGGVSKEHEDDINILIGSPIALIALLVALLYQRWISAQLLDKPLAFLLGVVLVLLFPLCFRLRRLGKDEMGEWCDMFLLLHLKPPRTGRSGEDDSAEGNIEDEK